MADITAITHLALTRWQAPLKLNVLNAADSRRMFEDVGFTISRRRRSAAPSISDAYDGRLESPASVTGPWSTGFPWRVARCCGAG
jgi:hypothetical protein